MRFVFQVAPVTLVMGAIFFLSHQPGDSLHLPPFPGADKLAHMVAYASLALTVLWFFGKKGQEQKLKTVVYTILFCLLYGVSDEFHQSFIPHRSVSGMDVVADFGGAALVALFWYTNGWLRRRVSVL